MTACNITYMIEKRKWNNKTMNRNLDSLCKLLNLLNLRCAKIVFKTYLYSTLHIQLPREVNYVWLVI